MNNTLEIVMAFVIGILVGVYKVESNVDEALDYAMKLDSELMKCNRQVEDLNQFNYTKLVREK